MLSHPKKHTIRLFLCSTIHEVVKSEPAPFGLSGAPKRVVTYIRSFSSEEINTLKLAKKLAKKLCYKLEIYDLRLLAHRIIAIRYGVFSVPTLLFTNEKIKIEGPVTEKKLLSIISQTQKRKGGIWGYKKIILAPPTVPEDIVITHKQWLSKKVIASILLFTFFLFLADLFNPFIDFNKTWNIFAQLRYTFQYYLPVYLLLCLIFLIVTRITLKDLYLVSFCGPTTYYVLKGVLFSLLVAFNKYAVSSLDPEFVTLGDFWLAHGTNYFWYLGSFLVGLMAILLIVRYIFYRIEEIYI